ncbi:TonB family protein [Wenzhouxiangella sp. EGI_FJ10305]|uniref:TonB family protein n=1 Tax=Wenzhouxiangella sp. EGI_FJ10305 TaxID=3243768 RepID=UPI0035E22411
MNEVLLEWLARASVLLTLLVPAAWVCSLALRRVLGARAAYAAWILVLPALTPRLEFLAGIAPLPSNGLLEPVRLETLRVSAESGAAGSLGDLLALTWLAGVLGFALSTRVRQRRFESLLRSGAEPPEVATRERARLTEYGLPARIPLCVSATVPGPMIVGTFPPRLYLPDSERLPEEVIAHEVAHIHHGDPFWRFLASAVRCTFWFLPWIHMAWGAFGKAQELAADEAVLARLDRAGRYRYARMLAAACGVHAAAPALGWFTHSLVKERIKMIGKTPYFSRSLPGGLVLVGAATLCITVAIAAPESALQHEEHKQHEQQEQKERNEQASDRLPPDGAEARAKIQSLREREPIEGDRLEPVVRVSPLYPRQAAMDGVTGHVKLEATLTENGHVVDIEVVESEPEGVFDAEAVQAFSQWRIAPVSPHESGTPQPVRIRQVMEFVLD